ncbi:MAG: hypothetical protein FJX75_15095 [Armatimonadetes bacterium]|nr:hypothetical protein [Armatimonadota bacterium]
MRGTVLALAATLAAGALIGPGCKSKTPTNTPEAVAQAFADAMAKGDTQAAAGLWNYVAEARKSNSDWDDIPSGQRQQIISKLKSSKVDELGTQTSLFASGMKAGTATTSGATATVQMSGGAPGGVTITLTQTDGKWGVSAFAAGGG